MNHNVNKTLMILGCGAVLAGGMVGSALVLSRFMVKVQKENTISVKGLSERQIESDQAAFGACVTVTRKTLPEGFQALNADFDKMLALLKKLGFSEDEIELRPMNYCAVNRVIDGKTSDEFSHYSFSRSVRVLSRNVELVQKESAKLNQLLLDGVTVSVDSPEFYISDQEQHKIQLITEATASAVQRAQATAEQLGGKVGKIITARNGIIQITRPASSDSSDYGYYDTSSRFKVMKVVVAIDFEIK